jgi:hypothetical protein
MKIWGDSNHCFSYIQYKFQHAFSLPGWGMVVWAQWRTFGHSSCYDSIKLVTMASVYIVFPCHACECANHWMHISSFFVEQFDSALLYLLTLLSVVVSLSVCFLYHLNKCHFCGLWKNGGGSSGCVNLTRQPILTSLLSHHDSDPALPTICVGNIAVQASVIVCDMSRCWILP